MPETEIDFIHLARTLWDSRKLIGKIMLISIISGLVVTFLLPVRYTATTLMVEESADPKITLNEEKLTAITALAGIAGVGLHRLTNGTMAPQTYANLIASSPFQQGLLNSTIHTSTKGEESTVKDYLQRTNTKQPITKLLSVQILDDQFILIKGTLKDAQAAAEMTRNAQEELKKLLTEIYTAKARENLKTIQERTDEALKHLNDLQKEIKESQQNKQDAEQEIAISLAEATTEELNKKLQQAKSILTEVTPLFKVIEPVSIPTEKSSPKSTKLIALFAFFGMVLAATIILGKGFISDTREKWNSNK